MSKKITFCSSFEPFDDIKPVPAKTMIPDWYKNIKPYTTGNSFSLNERGMTNNLTVKKCMPFLDMITSGYIIKTYCDIKITTIENIPFYEWATTPIDRPVITWHKTEQIPNYPHKDFNKDIQIAKFQNIWTIKTEPGYSCLFIPPAHHESPFQILPGIVDTDIYDLPVEFPFFLSNPNFNGLIAKGTPIVQIIPFKRDSWISDFEILDFHRSFRRLKSVFVDSYKKMFWTKKNYE